MRYDIKNGVKEPDKVFVVPHFCRTMSCVIGQCNNGYTWETARSIIEKDFIKKSEDLEGEKKEEALREAEYWKNITEDKYLES